jgi:2-polyprenyl-3-methyl-5-hydroxy-6-metoxy-1,4-benzoquinol methylase
MDEQQKYELVYNNVARYGKKWTTRAGATIKSWIQKEIPKQSTVMDFGCGNASSLEWLESVGYTSYGIDIATNANKHPNVVFADLRDKQLQLQKCDYGMCTDVMEHIPTEDVDIVLENISKSIRKSCIFIIARDEDKDGKVVGQVLHLTRKPKEWWDERILKYFSSVKVLRYTSRSAYCLWANK